MIDYYKQLGKLESTLLDLYIQVQSIMIPRFPVDLSPDEVNIILIIGKYKSLDMKTLAQHFEVNFNTMTGRINKLEGKQIVYRVIGKMDRRQIFIRLKDEWQETYEIYIQEQIRISKIVFQAFEKKKFDALLTTISDTSEKLKEEVPKIKRLV